MEFMIGCNYWASNAGVHMWKEFKPKEIDKDLKVLSEHGVKYMRVFPLWSDFQPVKPCYGGMDEIYEYVMQDDSLPTNKYYLDETMMDKFSQFCDICDKYGMKLIVGLVTGFMSGGNFVPTALYGKNILTDPLAKYFEQLFIKGFVEEFRDRDTIFAWDLGNECNSLSPVKDQYEAANWTATISNAIRASDPTRPVVSGMHVLELQGKWAIQDQAMFNDYLTTHPYPMWCRHTHVDETTSIRATMHATAESKWYADIGKKPCIAEEIGTMGPMVCSDEKAADFLRLNMFSLWANGVSGIMWWCNNDQDLLQSFPYRHSMIETELGLLTNKRVPKPAICEMKKFSEFLKNNKIDLPKAKENGVCLLTRHQDHWGVGYMTYILAKESGLNLKYAFSEDHELPDSNLYIVPSITGVFVMAKDIFAQLKQKVKDGADLYISIGRGYLQGFNELAGVKLIDTFGSNESDTVNIDGSDICFNRPFVRKMVPTTAKVLAEDSHGRPFIMVNKYGKGRIIIVDAPIEANLIGAHDVFDGRVEKIYQTVFKDHIEALPARTDTHGVAFTYHPYDDGAYLVAINHTDSEKELNLKLKDGYKVDIVVYGDDKTIKPFDACIIKLKK